MYLWKCWRDNRIRFIFFAAFVAAVGFLHAVITWLAPSHDRSSAAVTHYWLEHAREMWFLLPYLALLLMALGTLGAGEEFAQHTADFLFTRPCSRRYFIWMWWASGALSVFVIVCLYTLVTFFTVAYLTKTIYTWKVLASVLPALLVSLACYSLGCLMTTVLRSGRRGYAVGVGIAIVYGLLGTLLRMRWHVRVPDTTNLMLPFWHLVDGVHIPWVAFHFPVAAVAGWSVFVLACPLLAQLYIERCEI
jgi:ABC-type transport system involved in multi-copper enzyme maturation permease subunit